jgi:flagellar FliL protein
VPAPKPSPKTPAPAPAPKKSKKLLLIIVAVVVLAAGGGGAWFMLGNKHEDEGAEKGAKAGNVPAPAQYFALEPSFVVNLVSPDGSTRYLQTEVQLMSRDPVAIEDIKLHAPAIRARLLMLFSQESADGLLTRQGKEKLQAASLAEVKKLLVAETGKPGVDALMFTSFVVQ